MNLKLVNGGDIQMKITNKFGKEVNMYKMYDAYDDFKRLYQYYEENKSLVSASEMRERIEYIKKNGVKQRTEIETLCWILGENIIGEKE